MQVSLVSLILFLRHYLSSGKTLTGNEEYITLNNIEYLHLIICYIYGLIYLLI